MRRNRTNKVNFYRFENPVTYWESGGLWGDYHHTFGMMMAGRSDNPGAYRYGFNGKEKDLEVAAGGGPMYDYGFRIYHPGLGRFLSVDPLFRKFSMLTPYQFGSLSPIMCVDLDGKEGIHSISYQIFKAVGITTTTASEVEKKVVDGIEYAGHLSQDALIITGGVLAVVGSGGAALPIAFGVVGAGGGATKFYFDAQGDYDNSEATPTTISGVVMVTANYMVGEEMFSQEFRGTVEFVEGVATLDLKNLKSPNFTIIAGTAVNLLNLTIDATSIPDNLKGLLSPNTPITTIPKYEIV